MFSELLDMNLLTLCVTVAFCVAFATAVDSGSFLKSVRFFLFCLFFQYLIAGMIIVGTRHWPRP